MFSTSISTYLSIFSFPFFKCHRTIFAAMYKTSSGIERPMLRNAIAEPAEPELSCSAERKQKLNKLMQL